MCLSLAFEPSVRVSRINRLSRSQPILEILRAAKPKEERSMTKTMTKTIKIIEMRVKRKRSAFSPC